MMVLVVVIFGSNLFGTLCFLDFYVYFLHQIKRVFFHLTSCSSSSPSGILRILMLAHLEMSQRRLILPFLKKIICFFLPFWLNAFYSLCSKSLIWFLVSSPPLVVPCRFFFISLKATFTSAWIFFMWLLFLLSYPIISLSIQITSVLNSVSDRWLISISFSSFPGVLFYYFISSIFPCLLNLAASLCLFLCIR